MPQASLDSFAPEFRQGMAARAAELGDVGESGPDHWEKPLGTADVHVAIAVLSPGRGAARGGRRAGARAPTRSSPGVELIWRQDCYQLADRADLVRLQGRHRPARGRGQRHARHEPAASGRSRPARSSSATPTRPASCRRCRRPDVLGRNGTYVVFRKLHTRVAAYRQYLRARAASRAEEELLGAKMVGRWQSGAPLALAPEQDDPELGARPAAQQRLRLRRRPARLQVPGRRPRPAGQPARRARRRRQRRRPAAPDDPARHELRADAARGRARGRRRRPRASSSSSPARTSSGSSSSSRPSGSTTASSSAPRARRTRSSGRTTARAASPSRSGRSAAGCRTCRRSSSPAAASTASPRACARCAGSPSSTPDRHAPREDAR